MDFKNNLLKLFYRHFPPSNEDLYIPNQHLTYILCVLKETCIKFIEIQKRNCLSALENQGKFL